MCSSLNRLENKVEELQRDVDKIKSERLTYVDILGLILGGGIVIAWGDNIWNFIKGVFLLFTQSIYHVWERFFYYGTDVMDLIGLILSVILAVLFMISIVGLVLYWCIDLYVKIARR